MTATRPLLKHGEHIRPEYQALEGETEGAWGRSTDQDRPLSQTHGILRRFSKHEAAADGALTLGWIKALYQDAIEYTGMRQDMEGVQFFAAVLTSMCGIIGIGSYIYLLGLLDASVWELLILSIFLFITISMGAAAVRVAFRCPADLPIIFDRRHRKVYRILREHPPGLKGNLLPWPVKIVEYDWDLIDVEHNAEMYTTGNTLLRNHFLMFLVRKSADDPTIIDSFQLTSGLSMTEAMVPQVWEHVRRFMEDNGPHLPNQADPLASKGRRQSWWQACGEVGPFGAKYLWWWRHHTLITLFEHLILPILLPLLINWIQGTGKWLFHKTAIEIDWPDEVKQRIGQPTRQGEGW
ncbi:DUF6708 domain-containing protein [Chitinivorax sp. B]|uniref:DUF6708 domain-containing protein n=1 Tax=Chitinivorax sp. B TaxID=2502235 RepID=UPI0010FA0FD9|nr:DUF6708 domain-containing protein [Chitinivorax sp. B]